VAEVFARLNIYGEGLAKALQALVVSIECAFAYNHARVSASLLPVVGLNLDLNASCA